MWGCCNLYLSTQYLPQSNEVGNSARMEKEGMIRAMKEVSDNGVEIEEIVTDRHPAIVAHFKKESEIKHSIDIWHVAKGV